MISQEKYDLLLDKKLWLAPLAGITDSAFRQICKQNGADVLVSEMVSADGLIYNSGKTLDYLEFENFERPFGIQLFGSDPQIMAKSLEVVLKHNPDFVDINMGCPVKKVVKRGAGSALMKLPKIAEQIVIEMKKVLAGSDIPLSAKIRSGWDKSANSLDFASMLENSGIDFIVVHPRFRNQFFSGKSDWNVIAEIKEKLTIPVVGNGDVFDVKTAEDLYKKTNCDSIMIGRGAIGKPWLFDEIKSFLLTGRIQNIDNSEKFNVVKNHFNLTLKYKGDLVGIKEMRSHFSYYTKGFTGGSQVREFINHSTNATEILAKIRNLYEKNK